MRPDPPLKPKNVVGIILAAGKSQRMKTTKQLLMFHHKPVLQWVLDICRESDLNKIIIVLGHQKEKILQQIDFSQVVVVENLDYQSGQSSSLKSGLEQLTKDDSGAMFLLGDQPLLNKSTINMLINSYQKVQSPITLPVFNKKRGNPVLFDRSLFHELEQTTGDQGGRFCLKQHPESIQCVEVADEGIILDMDTQKDYQNLLKKPKPGRNRTLLEVLYHQPKELISLVGGGGKTSTMFTLAKEFAEKGNSVLVTTTTAIFHPDRDDWKYDSLYLGDLKKISANSSAIKSKIVVAAKSDDQASGKLKGYGPDEIDFLFQSSSFDYILVEADGSKGRPVKAPAQHEPVIPKLSTITIGVIGLESLGKAIGSVAVHRIDHFTKITSRSKGDHITTSDLAKLISEEQGLFKTSPPDAKRILILNQADTQELLEKGMRIVRKISNSFKHHGNIEQALICKMQSTKPVLDMRRFSG